MEDRGGRTELLLPYATLEPIRKLLLQQFMGEKFGRDSIWESHLATELWSTKVDIDAILDEQTMPLNQIMNLKVGQTMMLNATPDSQDRTALPRRAAADRADGPGRLVRRRARGRRGRTHRRLKSGFNEDISMMTLTFLVEVALEVLLAVTLCYCIVLERRLAAVRKGQEGLSRTIGELNMAIAGAGASLRALKAAAGEAAQTLDERLKRARLHIDEIVGAHRLGRTHRRPHGKRDHAARGAPELPRSHRTGEMNLPSGSIMSRLDTLRTAQ